MKAPYTVSVLYRIIYPTTHCRGDTVIIGLSNCIDILMKDAEVFNAVSFDLMDEFTLSDHALLNAIDVAESLGYEVHTTLIDPYEYKHLIETQPAG